MEGYFDVKSFGAIGDGIINDSFVIQKAIDEAAGTDGKGGVVWFPLGTYLIDPGPRIDRGIYVAAPLILAGAGMGVPFGNPLESDHIITKGSKLFVTNTDIVPVWISG
ncbi:pectate lyase superfamily protein domain-containing protein [Penicillium samsonianum]|uniref:pectate lyase superfamily protein domain-containing protein n=1 Tax=Penicillium samsonianum TaxID=1882272 RepID=UPI002546D7AF|nr:pectate lyase superfamily protein domain-containing protein [Penicillium samsonianum]KAJ6148803.1 pectate lyase superfamily protein domain-containing protein [Penicillium samsonianum]